MADNSNPTDANQWFGQQLPNNPNGYTMMPYSQAQKYMQWLMTLQQYNQMMNPPKAPSMGTQLGYGLGSAAAGGLGAYLGAQAIPSLLSGGTGAAAPVASSGVAAGIGSVAPAATSTAGGAGASTGAGMLGANGALATYGIPAAVIGSTILGGKALLDMNEGKDANPFGRATLGIATGGLSEIAKALGWGRKSLDDQNKDRFNALTNDGVRMHTDKAGYFTGEGKTKQDSELGAEDIWGSLDMYEKFGNDWLGKYTEEQRRAIAQEIINQQAAKQLKGDIQVDWSKVDPNIQGILDGTYKPQSPAEQIAASLQPMGTPSPAAPTQMTANTPQGQVAVNPKSSWLNKFAK